MDPGTGLTILGTAIGSAKIVEKVLGPTADYLGKSLCEFAQRRVHNIAHIIKIAAAKLGDRLDSHGQVPPKVLRILLDDGGFCDDPLIAEYFGGILASSRGEVSRDDRGAYFLSLIQRLTSYQLRAHYLFYSLMRRLYIGERVRTAIHQALREQSLLVEVDDFYHAMEFGQKEHARSLIVHISSGLSKETLIGDLEAERERDISMLTRSNILIIPTLPGIELFLWGHGKGHIMIHRWLSTKYDYGLISAIPEVNGSQINLTKRLQ